MTAPTLSPEQAVEIARKRIELFDDTRFFSGSMQSNIIAALQDAFAAGVATGEADRRDAERYRWLRANADTLGDTWEVSMWTGNKRLWCVGDELDARLDTAALAQTKQEPKYGGGGAVGVPVGAEIKWTEPPDAKS